MLSRCPRETARTRRLGGVADGLMDGPLICFVVGFLDSIESEVERVN